MSVNLLYYLVRASGLRTNAKPIPSVIVSPTEASAGVWLRKSSPNERSVVMAESKIARAASSAACWLSAKKIV